MNAFMNVMHTTTCNCAACASVPTLGIKMPYEDKPIKKNCLAIACPKVATMLSPENQFLANVETTGSNVIAVFICPECGQKFERVIRKAVEASRKGACRCQKCTNSKKRNGPKLIIGVNDLASQCPKAADMWSKSNTLHPDEVSVKSGKKAFFVCPDCHKEFFARVSSIVDSIANKFTGCPFCSGRSANQGVNDLASQCPKVADMWSKSNAFYPNEVSVRSGKKAFFVCPDCHNEFFAQIRYVVKAVMNGGTNCPFCIKAKADSKKSAKKSNIKNHASKKNVKNSVNSKSCKKREFIPCVNDLATQYPEIAAMWSKKNSFLATEITPGSSRKAIFVCPKCHEEFTTQINYIVKSSKRSKGKSTGCPVCRGFRVVSGVNDLASKYPNVAAMLSSKNPFSASEITPSHRNSIIFVCPDCHKEFTAKVGDVVKSMKKGFTGCYDCNMRRINAISKPEWFYTRPMLAFAGKNGIANPFSDVRNILGKNSRLGLDFVDHIQRLIYEYNGKYPHADAAEKDRFKFEAVRKAGYKGIRVLEPGLEVLDPKYDIVMPEGFYWNGKYNAEIMEEVGRKVIHLLEEIYGRKATPEIWALNNFEEFEVWYDANKKELEANAKKRGPKGKTAAKKAA